MIAGQVRSIVFDPFIFFFFLENRENPNFVIGGPIHPNIIDKQKKKKLIVMGGGGGSHVPSLAPIS